MMLTRQVNREKAYQFVGGHFCYHTFHVNNCNPLRFQMIVVLGALIATVASIPPKFPITDFNSQFLNAYLPMARRSFNGAIWAGELGVSYTVVAIRSSRKIIKIFRCERRLRLRQYVQYAQRADCNVVFFIFNK